MFLQSRFFRVISIFTIVLSLAVFAFADTIRLKDGSIIKGKIVSFGGGQFIIAIGEGSRQRQLKFFANEIDSIKFDSDVSSEAVNTTTTTTQTIQEPDYNQSNDGNNTVITVGSAPRTTTLPPADNTVNDDDDIIDDDDVADNNNSSNNSVTSPKPIEIQVKVLADNTSNGWTNAGWVVRKGQRIRIQSNGRVSLGNGRFSGPRGISTLPDENKLVKDQPTGGLIAVIGDDNNDFIFIGDGQEFIADRDGALFLGVNEGYLSDNTGAYNIVIEIAMN